ncbi:MAG: hypothetical protein GX039_00675 [Clostridia bacterium]|nr:hypothetical protein [Clostridia bacterium]
MEEAVASKNVLYYLRKLNSRLDRLEQGQKRLEILQREIAKIKNEMRAAWMDIKKLDDRITRQ